MGEKSVQEMKFGLTCGITVNRPWDCLHRHDEVELTFFRTRRPVIYRLSGKLIEIRASDTLLFWGALPHQLVDIEQGVEQYWLTIPPELFLRWNLWESLTRDVLNGKILTENDEELRKIDLASFPLWMMESSRPGKNARDPLYLSLEARIRRFGGGHPDAVPEKSGRELPADRIIRESSALRTMCEYIIRNYLTDIRVEEIAGAAGLHPNYATSLFRRQSGTNIVDFVTMLRVYEAQRLLMTTNKKIIDIAMDAGFGSMSNFYKTFNRICRKNPKSYRTGIGES
jgi:AraC-like DNA-binding protein